MLRVRSSRDAVRAAVIVSSVLAGACSRTDPAVQTAVDVKLSQDQQLTPLSIDVSINRGVVRLIGEVTSREQERRAIEIARSVDGVKDVVDEMYLGDATIVASVKTALAADPLVGRVPIEVDSTGGHIRLMSDQTDRDQRARAIEVAGKVDGVKQVEDRMR